LCPRDMRNEGQRGSACSQMQKLVTGKFQVHVFAFPMRRPQAAFTASRDSLLDHLVGDRE
jgi:hypothetical protein